MEILEAFLSLFTVFSTPNKDSSEGYAHFFFVIFGIFLIGGVIFFVSPDIKKPDKKVNSNPITVNSVGESVGKTTTKFGKGFFKGVWKGITGKE